MPVRLTEKQIEAQAVLGDGSNVMLWGGSRSGKTFIIIKTIIYRALAAPGSRHVILRFRFSHVKQSVILDTFPKVMRTCFPGVTFNLNKTDFFVTFGNESEIWFGGLDDKERTEKILGSEYSTIYLNEASQISWSSVGIVRTRLAQSVDIVVKNISQKKLTPRMYYDANPPSKAHWTYMTFIRKIDPETREPLEHPGQYVNLQMNPGDNLDNLADGYMDTLKMLSARQQRRFLDGKFSDATPGQLFTEEDIDKWRIIDADRLPDFVRVVVGVDPSGADDVDNADNDEIGIMVGGLGTDGNAYLLEDVTVKAGPATWGRVAASAWERHAADCIVAEVNFGGAMVKQTIHVANARIPYRKVTASRGKVQRAEPFSALYETGKIRHVGRYDKLEDELTAFSTVGYLGDQSPNRADAWIWVLAELFSGIVKPKPVTRPRKTAARDYQPGGCGWMR